MTQERYRNEDCAGFIIIRKQGTQIRQAICYSPVQVKAYEIANKNLRQPLSAIFKVKLKTLTT